ncbi:MAG: DUF2017 domain-containing protein [Actinomycetia bacterium]|nr:DUF2017 domain-containing protein [Actinomycetes bacterium]
MKVARRGGQVTVRLAGVEAEVLAGLLGELAVALVELAEDDPVRQRLFPDGYRDDVEAAAEFRELTESSLRAQKVARLGRCRAELSAGAGRLDLDDEATGRWLTVLNDLRLALGTRQHVTEDDEPQLDDPSNPRAQALAVYYWLTALQDLLVQAIMV